MWGILLHSGKTLQLKPGPSPNVMPTLFLELSGGAKCGLLITGQPSGSNPCAGSLSSLVSKRPFSLVEVVAAHTDADLWMSHYDV